jgi:hypothetical protein
MNLWQIKQLYLVLCFSLVLTGYQQINAQQSQKTKEPPQILKAVAPTFIPFVFNETGVAEMVVEVKINSDGKVTASKIVDVTLFRDLGVESTAKQWIFERSTNRKERIARIKFVFRIMPKETDTVDLTTIFRHPLEVEVRKPIFDSPITTAPLPDQEKP